MKATRKTVKYVIASDRCDGTDTAGGPRCRKQIEYVTGGWGKWHGRCADHVHQPLATVSDSAVITKLEDGRYVVQGTHIAPTLPGPGDPDYDPDAATSIW